MNDLLVTSVYFHTFVFKSDSKGSFLQLGMCTRNRSSHACYKT